MVNYPNPSPNRSGNALSIALGVLGGSALGKSIGVGATIGGVMGGMAGANPNTGLAHAYGLGSSAYGAVQGINDLTGGSTPDPNADPSGSSALQRRMMKALFPQASAIIPDDPGSMYLTQGGGS